MKRLKWFGRSFLRLAMRLASKVIRKASNKRARVSVLLTQVFGSEVRKRIFRSSSTANRDRDAWELDYVACWVERNMDRVNQRAEQLRGEIQAPLRFVPMVYMYWDQGFDNAPELIKWLRNRALAYHDDMQVCSLALESIDSLVPLPDNLWKRLRLPNHRANLLRLELLARHGGVWLDSTCLVNVNILDSFSEFFENRYDFFAFYDNERPRIRNWCMASVPKGYIATTMLAAWRMFVEENWDFCNYQSYHFFRWLFEAMYYIDEGFRNAWLNQSSTVDVLPSYCFVRTMKRTEGDIKVSSICLRNANIHKLTHKRPEQINIGTIQTSLQYAGLA